MIAREHGKLPYELGDMPTDDYMELIAVKNFERQVAQLPPVIDNGAPLGFEDEIITEEISFGS